jgi:hypothetical protein
LCRCKIGARFVLNIPLAQKLSWTHTVVLLGDEAQMEARFSPFGGSGNLEARFSLFGDSANLDAR